MISSGLARRRLPRTLHIFFATAAMNGRSWKQEEERQFLQYYHGELCTLLEAQGDKAPPFEQLYVTYRLAVVDYGRWVEGGFSWGNTDLIGGHTKEFLNILQSGAQQLTSEADYRRRIFECFPV